MTSFGYRLNPRYTIKECSSCGTLYTKNCSCSKGNVEEKILVPKPPKNCARCAKCGHPRIKEEQAASARYWKIPACCDDDDDYDSAITPVLSTEETDTILATESDEVIKYSVENLVLIPCEFEALKDNPSQSSKLLTKSSSTSLNSLLEETNTFHNSLPEFENFYFDLGEISSGSTTTHSDISLSEYDSFIFDLTHEEFVDELAHIISSSEYDCFYFRDLPDPGELIYVLNSGIRENLPSATSVNLPIEDDHSPLLAYVVWIFVAYLTYPVIPPYLHPFGNEDTIFNPGITINLFYSFKPGLSHRLLHLAGSQPMLKSSYKANASVIISIPPLVGGVADVVVEIKGAGLQTPDDLSRSRLGFIEKMDVHG
nr:hypothetical protein [Tanacetum cinerariifolium]